MSAPPTFSSNATTAANLPSPPFFSPGGASIRTNDVSHFDRLESSRMRTEQYNGSIDESPIPMNQTKFIGLSQISVESDINSMKNMLRTSLSEKIELRHTVEQLQMEMDHLRAGRMSGYSGNSGRSVSPTKTSGSIISNSAISNRSIMSNSRGASPLRTNKLKQMSQMQESELDQSIASGAFRLSIRKYKKLRIMLFRSITYQHITYWKKLYFKKWHKNMCKLRYIANKSRRHLVVSRVVDDYRYNLRSLSFLKWKYALITLQRVELRTYRAIKMYLKRRLLWKLWFHWLHKYNRRVQIRSALRSRLVNGNKILRGLALRRWRTTIMVNKHYENTYSIRSRCGIRIMITILRKTTDVSMRKAWFKLKQVCRYATKDLKIQYLLLNQALRVVHRKLSIISVAIRRWRVAAHLLGRQKRALSAAVSTVRRTIFDKNLSLRFHRWKENILKIKEYLQLSEHGENVKALTTATLKEQMQAAAKAAEEAAALQVRPIVIPVPVLRRMSKFLSSYNRTTLPCAYYWWKQSCKKMKEVDMHLERGLKRIKMAMSRRYQGKLGAAFIKWMNYTKTMVEGSLLSHCKELKEIANNKHQELRDVVAYHQEVHLKSLSDLEERDCTIGRVHSKLENLMNLLLRSVIRKVFMGHVSKAFQIWARNIQVIIALAKKNDAVNEGMKNVSRQHGLKRLIAINNLHIARHKHEKMKFAMRRWCSMCTVLGRQHSLIRRVVNKLIYRGMYNSFVFWKQKTEVDRYRERHITVCKANATKAILRWLHVKLYHSFTLWKQNVHKRTGREKILFRMFYLKWRNLVKCVFGVLRKKAFYDYIYALKDSFHVEKQELVQTRIATHISNKIYRQMHFFSIWKQYVKLVSKHRRILLNNLQNAGSVRLAVVHWKIWRSVLLRRRKLKCLCARKDRIVLSRAIGQWKDKIIECLQETGESAVSVMKKSLIKLRESTKTLAMDNVALVGRLKTNGGTLHRMMGKIRYIVEMQSLNRTIRNAFARWSRIYQAKCQRRLAFVFKFQVRIQQGLTQISTLRHCLEHWKTLYYIRQHARRHARNLKRGCFNGWRLFHYYCMLQRQLLSKMRKTSRGDIMYKCFIYWKFCVVLQYERQYRVVHRIMNSNGKLGDVLYKVKRKSINTAFSGWKGYIRSIKESKALFKRKITLIKSNVLKRWKKFATSRRVVRHAITILGSFVRTRRDWVRFAEVSNAWRKWQFYISLRVRSTVVGTWDRCRKRQKRAGAKSLRGNMMRIAHNYTRKMYCKAWKRWKNVVLRHNMICQLFQLVLADSLSCSTPNSCGIPLSKASDRRGRLTVNQRQNCSASLLAIPPPYFPTRLHRIVRLTSLKNAILQWKFSTACAATADLSSAQKLGKMKKFVKIVENGIVGLVFGHWKAQSKFDIAHKNFSLKVTKVSQSIVSNLCGYHEYYMQVVQQLLFDVFCGAAPLPPSDSLPNTSDFYGNRSSKLNISALHANDTNGSVEHEVMGDVSYKYSHILGATPKSTHTSTPIPAPDAMRTFPNDCQPHQFQSNGRDGDIQPVSWDKAVKDIQVSLFKTVIEGLYQVELKQFEMFFKYHVNIFYPVNWDGDANFISGRSGVGSGHFELFLSNNKMNSDTSFSVNSQGSRREADTHASMLLKEHMDELKSNSNVRKCFETKTWHAIVDTHEGALGMISPTVTSIYIPLLLWDYVSNEEVAVGVILFVLKDEFRSPRQMQSRQEEKGGSKWDPAHQFSHYKMVESLVTSNLKHFHSSTSTVPGALYVSQLTEVCDLMQQPIPNDFNVETGEITPEYCRFIALCTSLAATIHGFEIPPCGTAAVGGGKYSVSVAPGVETNNRLKNPLWRLFELNHTATKAISSVQSSLLHLQERQQYDLETKSSFLNESKAELIKVLTENEGVLNKKEKDLEVLLVDRNNAVNKYQVVKQKLKKVQAELLEVHKKYQESDKKCVVLKKAYSEILTKYKIAQSKTKNLHDLVEILKVVDEERDLTQSSDFDRSKTA